MGNSNERTIEGLPDAQIYDMPLLEKEETQLILNHYKRLGALFGSMDGLFLDKKYFLSGGVPEKLFECIVYDAAY